VKVKCSWLGLVLNTYDFPQDQFRLGGRHVDDESLAVDISLVDLFQRPVDVASVGHAINIGLHWLIGERDRRQELLQALQSCRTTHFDWRSDKHSMPLGVVCHP